MRVELRLADQRSAQDIERLVNARTLRLWPGGQDRLRLQSDYSYRRQTPKWVHLACSWNRFDYDSPTNRSFLGQLAAAGPERAHAEAVAKEHDRGSIQGIVDYFRDSEKLSPQEFLAATTLSLSHKTTAQEVASLFEHGFLESLFGRYPDARLLYLAVDPESSQRLSDLVLLHLYELQQSAEVRHAILESGFFPQAQSGFSPVNLVSNCFLTLSGFFYPWLYVLPVSRPGGVFLLLLNEPDPFNLGLETPSVLETLGLGLGQIHGHTAERLSDLGSFLPSPPAAADVESLVLDVAERMNSLLVALYDLDGFSSLDEQLSACFTVSRLSEEVATGVLSTNSYLRKVAFFNAWDKVTCVQSEARKGLRESEVKKALVQPAAFRAKILAAIPETAPMRSQLQRVLESVLSHLEETVVSGTAPWASRNATQGERRLSEFLVSYRNTIHGYGRERLSDYLSHAGLIPDSLIYLAAFWWLAIVYRPSDFLQGRWV